MMQKIVRTAGIFALAAWYVLLLGTLTQAVMLSAAVVPLSFVTAIGLLAPLEIFQFTKQHGKKSVFVFAGGAVWLVFYYLPFFVPFPRFAPPIIASHEPGLSFGEFNFVQVVLTFLTFALSADLLYTTTLRFSVSRVKSAAARVLAVALAFLLPQGLVFSGFTYAMTTWVGGHQALFTTNPILDTIFNIAGGIFYYTGPVLSTVSFASCSILNPFNFFFPYLAPYPSTFGDCVVFGAYAFLFMLYSLAFALLMRGAGALGSRKARTAPAPPANA